MAEKKDVKRYKCMNFGACTKADQGTIIEINALETIGGTPDCPYCHQHTLEEQIKKPTNWKLIGGIAAAVVVLGGGAALMFTGGGEKTKVEGDKVVEVDSVKTQPEKILVKQLSIVDGDIALKEGESKQLSKTVEPEKHDEVISWSSDNEAVATVDNAGNVTAVKKGTANIKIAADSSGVSASVKVTVNDKPGTGPNGGGNVGGGTAGTTGQGTKVYGYGKYVGYLKNGLPDGTGKLTFTRSYQLNGEYTAQPGEYIQGIFENGKPTFVTYYKNDGTVTKIKLR